MADDPSDSQDSESSGSEASEASFGDQATADAIREAQKSMNSSSIASALAGIQDMHETMKVANLAPAIASMQTMPETLEAARISPTFAAVRNMQEAMDAINTAPAFAGLYNMQETLEAARMAPMFASNHDIQNALKMAKIAPTLAGVGSTATTRSRNIVIEPDEVLPADSDLETEPLNIHKYYSSPDWLSAQVTAVAILLTEYILRWTETYHQNKRARQGTNVAVAIFLVIVLPQPVWTKMAAIYGIASGLEMHHKPELEE